MAGMRQTRPEPASSQPAPAPDGRLASAPPHLGELLALASELARDAARVHIEGRRVALDIETKSSPTDLVSQIDREAERLIVDRLREIRPDDAVLAEEGAAREGTSGVRWVIDPLDGTTNYVYGYPAFAVSIAVEIDGRPQIGVVHDSSSGHVYQAISGFGAVCDDRPLRVREQPDLGKALVATGFSYEAAQRELQGLVVAQLLSRVRDLRRGGSAALDLCHVAAGHVDAYWETGLAPWDYAAGLVIAREAGAEVLVLDVAPRRGPAVVAAPPSLMPDFLGLLREAGALVEP
jgi:myo-inositol-1(or 4)-monophosphatase